MRERVLALVLVSAAVPVLGCGSQSPAPSASEPTPPEEYVEAVQELLVPPARLASLATERSRPRPEADPPSQSEVDGIVMVARRELAELRAQRLDDPALRRQRDALAGAYHATISRMERVGRDLVQDDRAALRRNLPTLFSSMRGLSSAVSPR